MIGALLQAAGFLAAVAVLGGFAGYVIGETRGIRIGHSRAAAETRRCPLPAQPPRTRSATPLRARTGATPRQGGHDRTR